MADRPQYRASGSDLPKGQVSALDESLDTADAAPEVNYAVGAVDQSEIPEIVGESTDDIDAELFAPSDHPSRPVTHGTPIGPGSNFTVRSRMSDRAILTRAASGIVDLRDSVPTDAVVWAVRVLAGE